MLRHNSNNDFPPSFISTSTPNNDTNVIVQRINDLHGICSAAELDNYEYDIDMAAADTVMVEDDADDSELRNPAAKARNNNQQTNMDGVVVNGFYPQLSTWQKNQSDIQTCADRKNSLSLDEHICDTASSSQSEEHEHEHDLGHPKTTPNRPNEHFSRDTAVSDIYRDMFENSNMPQVIATPGGRFGACKLSLVRIYI